MKDPAFRKAYAEIRALAKKEQAALRRDPSAPSSAKKPLTQTPKLPAKDPLQTAAFKKAYAAIRAKAETEQASLRRAPGAPRTAIKGFAPKGSTIQVQTGPKGGSYVVHSTGHKSYVTP